MNIRFQIIALIVLAVALSVNSKHFHHHGRSKPQPQPQSSSNSTLDDKQLHALLGTLLTVKIGVLTALRDGLTRKSGNDTNSSGLGGLLGGGGSSGFNPLALIGPLLGPLLGGTASSSSSSSSSAKSDSFDDFEDVEEGDSVFAPDES